jgi:hypothetical protein
MVQQRGEPGRITVPLKGRVASRRRNVTVRYVRQVVYYLLTGLIAIKEWEASVEEVATEDTAREARTR